VFQPAAYEGLQRGINKLVKTIRPTLGPLPRIVAIDGINPGQLPETLDNGGLIARRIIQLPNRDEDMGAMYVRHMLWRLHEKVGDGTATAAVVFQSIYDQGVTYITSGGDAQQLRRYLEKGLRVILNELGSMAMQLEGKEHLAQIAESICYDPPLSKMLGEIFDIVGEYGRLEIRSGRGRELEREYVEGMYWDGGILSRQMIIDQSLLRTELEDAAILLSDLEIEDPRILMPVIKRTIDTGSRSLLILAQKLSDLTIAFLVSVSKKEPDKFQAIAAKSPGAVSDNRATALEDLAILTGGRPFVRAAGYTRLDGIEPNDLGRARRVWADRHNFGIVGGKGDPRALREHLARLRNGFKQAEDQDARKKFRERIGKLMGGSATLWIGGLTEVEIKARKEAAERTADALRGTITEGVLPGGGVALLSCRPALQRLLEQSTDADERAAYRILIKAMEEPIRTILSNAGYDASEVMAEIRMAGPGHGFDVRSGKIVDTVQVGILDAANVQKEAMHSAIASAGLALTVDVLIQRKTPPQAFETA
jgi:chaperonin GroEL